MTIDEIIDGLEIYTVGRLKKNRVHITVEELQKFIDAIKVLEQEPRQIHTSERYPKINQMPFLKVQSLLRGSHYPNLISQRMVRVRDDIRHERDKSTYSRILGITPQAVSHGIHRGSKLYQVIEDGETE